LLVDGKRLNCNFNAANIARYCERKRWILNFSPRQD